MKTYIGDIWELVEEGFHLVIPVNIGWTHKGANVMGRGLAKQAVDVYGHGVAEWLGKTQREVYEVFKESGNDPNDPETIALFLFSHEKHPLIFFPTKPLNTDAPNLSWQDDADIDIIRGGLAKFSHFLSEMGINKAAVPLLGAGNGGLDPGMIKELIEEVLGGDHRVAVVLPETFGNGKENGWQT